MEYNEDDVLRGVSASSTENASSTAFQRKSKRATRNEYPEPLIVAPSKQHTHTLILLHGRGSNASRFGLEFLSSELSSKETLPQVFPSMKFIFPTAKKRRSTVLKRLPINQWFDNWSLEDTSLKQDLQYDGLRETSAFLHAMIDAEAKLVGLRNVIIGGLSQGCATALHVLLNYKADLSDQAFGGFIGMSGWLPFEEAIASTVWRSNADDEDNPFVEADEEKEEENVQSWQVRAANFARDIVDLPSLEEGAGLPSFVKTPIFLGHGKYDEKVWLRLGEQARDLLVKLGLDITWKAYDIGHWYKVPDQIDDIVAFLRQKVMVDENLRDRRPSPCNSTAVPEER